MNGIVMMLVCTTTCRQRKSETNVQKKNYYFILVQVDADLRVGDFFLSYSLAWSSRDVFEETFFFFFG